MRTDHNPNESTTLPLIAARNPQNWGSKAAFTARFQDSEHWDELARRYVPGRRRPCWDEPSTARMLRRWLKRIGVPEHAFLAMGAYRSLADFIALNTDWPLRAAIGLMLELAEETRQSRLACEQLTRHEAPHV